MRVVMSQPQFVPLYLNGTKDTTIRDHARCKPGDVLSLRVWEGKPRRKGSRQREFARAVCGGVDQVRIRRSSVTVGLAISLAGFQAADDVANRDGFKDFADMAAWFRANHGLPYRGERIRMADVRATEGGE